MVNDKDGIQTRLLANIDDKYDKSEGGFFYDAEKPVAIELESAYVEIGGLLDKRYADTATGLDLDRVVKDVGISRKLAVKVSGVVTITGIVGSSITKGEKVASDSINYVFTDTTTVIPANGTIDVNVQCETSGTTGNVPVGAIKYFPKTLAGLQTVTNKLAFNNGYDMETDAELRVRYYTKVQTPATSGNIYQYKNWALEVTGVGNARIVPLWAGNGTVKVILVNSNKVGADTTLVSNVASHIEDNSPIGATVTVVSAIEKAININATLVIDSTNTTMAQVIADITNNVKYYLKSIAFKQNYVSYAKIGSIILESDGITDYNNLKINDGIVNVSIADTEVAVLGSVTNV